MTTKPIKIIDQPCGSGKTTAMINNFNNQDKYLVIVPLLSEVDRIVEGSKEVVFVQPLIYVPFFNRVSGAGGFMFRAWWGRM